MPSTHWGKFYWSDWASDPALRVCSLAAQGLWMRMLCVAAEAKPVGHVQINGRGVSVAGLARLAGVSSSEVETLLDELDRNGVFSRTDEGVIYSRRMVSDARKSATAREHGLDGGNPALKPKDNPDDQPPHNGTLKGQRNGQLKGTLNPTLKASRARVPTTTSKEERDLPTTVGTTSAGEQEGSFQAQGFVVVASYSDAELETLQVEFGGVDVAAVVPELLAWAVGKAIPPIEQKSAVYGALQQRQAKAELAARLAEPPAAIAVSDALVASLSRRRQA